MPTARSCWRSSFSCSEGMITIGTEKEDSASMKVGCTCFMRMTKVRGSGVSQPATLSSVLRCRPMRL